MQITVKTLTGRKAAFDFEPTNTVRRRTHSRAQPRDRSRHSRNASSHTRTRTRARLEQASWGPAHAHQRAALVRATSPQLAPLRSTLCALQILQIKETLQEKEGIDVKQIRLVHGGKQLCVLGRRLGAERCALSRGSWARGGASCRPSAAAPRIPRAGTTPTPSKRPRSRRARRSTWSCLSVVAGDDAAHHAGRDDGVALTINLHTSPTFLR